MTIFFSFIKTFKKVLFGWEKKLDVFTKKYLDFIDPTFSFLFKFIFYNLFAGILFALCLPIAALIFYLIFIFEKYLEISLTILISSFIVVSIINDIYKIYHNYLIEKKTKADDILNELFFPLKYILIVIIIIHYGGDIVYFFKMFKSQIVD
jgi:hypothetical protein